MSGFGRGVFLKPKASPAQEEQTPSTSKEASPSSAPAVAPDAAATLLPPQVPSGRGDAFGRFQPVIGRSDPIIGRGPGRGLLTATPGIVSGTPSSAAQPSHASFGRGVNIGAPLPPGGRGVLFASPTLLAAPRGSVIPSDKPRELQSPKEQAQRGGIRGRIVAVSTRSSEESLPGKLSAVSLEEESESPPVVMKGTSGFGFTAHTNYIRLTTDPDKGIFQYDVKFKPEIDSRNLRFKVMKQLADKIGDTKSFDGAILYLPVKLEDQVTKATAVLPQDNSPIEVTIMFTKALKMGDPHAVHLYNVIFRRCMGFLGLAEHGRHFFDPNGVHRIPEFQLEVWPGFVTSIQNFEGGVMLCCDASHRVLRTGTVHQLISTLPVDKDEEKYRDSVRQLVLGNRVLTRYNNKIYRVDDVDFNNSPRSTFTMRDGTQISYMDYYRQQYSTEVKDPHQPLLRSVVKRTVRGQEETQNVDLIPELCYLTGITDAMRADFKVMKAIAQTTQAKPEVRVQALTKFIKNVNANKDARVLLDSWGLKLADSSEPLEARTLAPEDIFFGNDESFRGSEQVDWTRGASNYPVIDAVDFTRWFIVCTQRDERTVMDFVAMVKQVSRKLGITVQEPTVLTAKDDSQFVATLKSRINKGAVSMIVIVLPLQRADRYSKVKKFCCHEYAVPSQVILTRTIRNPEKLRSVTIKIVLQMNCKLGGTLWAVKIPLKQTMVVGLDAFHHASKPSVGAIVASMNQPLTRWYSKIYKSGRGIELQDGLEAEFIHCLRVFQQVNGNFPEQIVMYRDGVSDGQVKMVCELEIPQLLAACSRIIPDYTPKFLVVIVQKKISTRYYKKEGRGVVNPVPGSVLDHTVTRRDMFDFFLVSASTRIGTVTPTHYIVAYNTTSLDADKIQRFTYKTTHLYYNWSGTVRVPAPCLYAHKLAYLVGEAIDREADESLADKLYYL